MGQQVADFLYSHLGMTLTYALIIIVPMALVFSTIRRWRIDTPIEWTALGVPLFYDSILLLVFITNGGIAQAAALVVMLPVFTFCSVLFFSWPSLIKFVRSDLFTPEATP
jgi:hypothetical protein